MSHIQYDVVRNDDQKVVFSVKGRSWGEGAAGEAVVGFLLTQINTQINFSITSNGRPVFLPQDPINIRAAKAMHDIIKAELCSMIHVPWNVQKGDHGIKKTAVFTIKWKCLSRMSPRRAQHIIDAEKAVSAANQAKKAGEREEAQKRAEHRVINARNRIINQINYAFSQGKAGTEPAAKFITCQHCDAPAACVTLKHALPKGAAVLDEDVITGANCSEHDWYRGEKIPCARLEFFYDGVRQIAIKAAA